MNPQDKNTKVAFWLVPAREEAGFLAQLIQALATRYEALLFEPHVTIFSTDAACLARQRRCSRRQLKKCTLSP